MGNKKFEDKELRLLLSHILRYGVFAALGIVTIGLIMFLFDNGSQQINYTRFFQKDFDFITFSKGLLQGKSLSIMALGILLLILTPILRVIFAIVGFYKEKDTLYTGISIIVLVIIIVSALLGAFL